MVLKKMKLLIILGPTSTGKTDLALKLAKKFNGEVIACDSRQVYVGLDIGTGKLPGGKWKMENGKWKKGKGFWEINGIKIWMYDVIDPKRQYTVYDFVKDANQVIDGIIARGKLPIIVGGTGLYLKAVLSGLPNLAIPVNRKLRKELEKLSLKKLQEKLQKISPKKWGRMNNSDRQNPRRLIRAVEIASTDFTSEESLRATIRGDFNTLKIGLTAPRQVLYQRIDERVVSRIYQGMIEEVKQLYESGLSFKRMRQLGLEYGILANYLEGKITNEEELVKILQGEIHGFARRQITWFKKEKNVLWFDIMDQNFPGEVEKIVNRWYY
ncbi:MAG: tRNA (adenosine(37)-N6)-dimethylallyltransferase MiaA [Candidatus Daviesbacteria bacterium]|nr:tRNA (adenosine(37)-N6)-dimethylallyltransferase MiaA [Candidatus Daviesbacteria bacterium]